MSTPPGGDDDGPRSRTRAHLRGILAAVTGLALQAGAHADTSVPPGQKKPDGNKPGDKQPAPPRESLGYEVVDMLPEPAPVGNGWVSIATTPDGAEVQIDGVTLPTHTPVGRYELKAGKHTLVLRLPGGPPRTLQITIRKGEGAHIKAILKGPKR